VVTSATFSLRLDKANVEGRRTKNEKKLSSVSELTKNYFIAYLTANMLVGYKILIEKPEWKRVLGRTGNRW
jgi:hypothetical protein